MKIKTERKHHSYSPSTLQMREASPCYDPAQGDSDASRAGTLQHDAFESRDLSILHTDEQIDAVQKCLDFFDGRLLHYRTTFPGKAPFVVKEAYLPVDEEATTAGYIDCAIIAPDHSCADLIDLKFGKWAVEPAENNLQGIAYALGLVHAFPQIKTVRVWFLQPYLDTMDTCVFEEKDFPKLYLRIKTVVARAKNRAIPLQPTTGTCLFCANIGTCPAVVAMAVTIGKKYAPMIVPDDIAPSTIATGADPSMAMRLTDLMAAWAKGARAQITALAVEEQKAPEGYKIVTASRDKIIDPAKLREIAGRVLSPAEIEAAVKYTFGPLEEAIEAKAPRGAKKAAVESFRTTLVEEKAVEKGGEFSYLEMIKVKD